MVRTVALIVALLALAAPAAAQDPEDPQDASGEPSDPGQDQAGDGQEQASEEPPADEGAQEADEGVQEEEGEESLLPSMQASDGGCRALRTHILDPRVPVQRWIMPDPDGCYREFVYRIVGRPPSLPW